MEHKPFVFKVKANDGDFPTLDAWKLAVTAQGRNECPDGWEPDNYYNSRDSFTYAAVNGIQEVTAHTTIRRWVDYKNEI